jgi:hypothetical protein
MQHDVALVRFLASPAVQRSPEMRRAVGDLFELPMRIELPEQVLRPRLGTLERIAAWVSPERLLAGMQRVLAALQQVPKAQRQTLCARLLAQEPVALMLALLEQSGWVRPPWLSAPATEGSEAAAQSLLADEEEPAGSAADQGSRQLFLYARRSWQSRLSRSPDRALAIELLGIQFWSPSWQDRPQEDLVMPFYQTLMKALHPRLRAVLGAAWLVATEQKLSRLAELVGLVGCLPPLLPAQLDHPRFFEAMQERLSPASDGQEDRLRHELEAVRARTHAWFLAMAGLADDNEQRILLAAMSLAAGKADPVEHWIAGQQPSQAEIQALLKEVKRWQHQTTITEQLIPSLLLSAAEQVRPVWQQLRSAPSFEK